MIGLWHRRFGDDDVAVLHAAVFALWAALIARVDVAVWAAWPDQVFTRSGPGVWLVPAVTAAPAAALTVAKWATVAACVGCAALRATGRWPATTAAATAAAAAAVAGFDTMMKASGGYPNHGQTALLWITVLVTVDSLTRRPRTPDRTGPTGDGNGGGDGWWVVVLSAALLAATYVTVGVRRLVAGGPDVFVDGTVAVWAAARAVAYGELEPGSWLPGDGLLTGAGMWLAARPAGVAALTAALAAVTVLEVAAPLALLDTRLRRWWVTGIAVFHVATFAVMKVPFVEHLVLLAVLHTRPAAHLTARRARSRPPDLLPSTP